MICSSTQIPIGMIVTCYIAPVICHLFYGTSYMQSIICRLSYVTSSPLIRHQLYVTIFMSPVICDLRSVCNGSSGYTWYKNAGLRCLAYYIQDNHYRNRKSTNETRRAYFRCDDISIQRET